jgi:hypothetical protein
MFRITKILAITNILIFFLEFFLLVFGHFGENSGATKDVVLFYFIILYIWLFIPSLVFLLLNAKIKNKKIVSWIFLILNSVILIYNIPMLFDYIKRK